MRFFVVLAAGIVTGGLLISCCSSAEAVKAKHSASSKKIDNYQDKLLSCPKDYSIGRFYLLNPCRITDQTINVDQDAQSENAQGIVHIKGAGKLAFIPSYKLLQNMQPLANFKADDLQILDLSDTLFEESGLSHITKLTGLQRLQLEGTEVTDDCLQYIARLTNLEFVNISKATIKGTTLEKLVPLKRLVRLEVGHNTLKNSSLGGLAKLQTLKTLRLQNCELTDEGLRPVGAIVGLETLIMHDNPKITDAGLRQLTRLKKLVCLGVGHTAITVGGLKALADLPLQSLRIYTNQFTPSQIERIQAIFPKAELVIEKAGRKVDHSLFAPLH